MITLSHITKSFDKKLVLNSLSFTFKSNSFYILRGDNMSGKTTLLYLISLLDKDYKGEIIIDGQNARYFTGIETKTYSKKSCSFIPAFGNLISCLKIKDNIDHRINIASLGLNINIEDYPSSLSGGEKMILSVENEIIKNKKIILLDEITSELDDNHTIQVLEALKKKTENSLIILATHDKRAFSYGTNVLLKDGKLYD